MEYVQMTLNDWMEVKQKLKRELLGVKQSFVRIGFMLRQIEEQKLYENDGYKSIAEFAKAELGLEASTTSRFISINREYSVDGYSETLSPQYAELGRSQLEEMLKLPEEDRRMVQPETSRQDIRDLKKFNKSEPEAGVADDISQVIKSFFKENKDILNDVFSEKVPGPDDAKRLAEIINPSGNRSYRKGIFYLIMYEDKIAVKKFGAPPQEMTWPEFIRMTVEIFGDAAAGRNTWQRYFGEESGEDGATASAENQGGQQAPVEKEPEEKQALTEKESEVQQAPMEKEPEQQQAVRSPAENSVGKHEKTEENEIAPAQKNPEKTESDTNFEETKEDESIPGQMEITKDMPEYCPPFMNEPVEPEKKTESPEAMVLSQKKPENTEVEEDFQDGENPEEIDRPYGSRKAYLDTLTEYKAALYIAAHIWEMRNKTFAELADAGEWEKWMRAEVDSNGEEIEVVEYQTEEK